MRRILLLILLFPFCFNAQITISDADMLQSGDMYFYSTSTDFSLVDVSLTGVNYSWDNSAITSVAQDTLEAVSVLSTPFAYQLYFNNSFQYPEHKADYAVVGQEIDAFGQVTISDVFDYFKVNSGSLEKVGFGANINGLPASVKFDTIDQVYPLSMTYGTSDSTSAYYILDIPTLGAYGQWIRRKVEVDGWGDITTPYAAYSNTIRVKTTLYQRDTLYVDQFGFGTNVDRPVETTYEWFEPGSGAPVFVAKENAGNLTEIKYLDTINTTNIESQFYSNWRVYPNPVVNVLNVEIGSDFTYEIYDMEGRLVERVNNITSDKVDLGYLSKGVYTLLLKTGDKRKSYKLIKE